MKTLRFAKMMHSLGHQVYHYGGEDSEVQDFTAEDIPVISRAERKQYFGEFDPNKLYTADWSGRAPYWKLMNDRAAAEIVKRKRPGDFVCVIMGSLNVPLANQVGSDVMVVEYGIGYNGTFAKYRVFESYAHMHKIWGAQGGYDPDGKFYDVVIPNYLDPCEYPFQAQKQDYFLYLGRLVKRKGIHIAVETCKKLNAKLLIAGQGCVKVEGNAIHCADGEVYCGDNLEYVGVALGEKRAQLYQNAKGVFLPTQYIEPFGTVGVEAQMAGTPVITTDFGVFPETVEQGKTGFRCHTLNEFVWAAKQISTLNPQYIHERAMAKYSMDAVKWQYQTYFERLADLWKSGWYELHDQPDIPWLRGYV
jgi:glycosyltransferase involved in cell wall biosynthesis